MQAANHLKIAIAVSIFNEDITTALLEGALSRLSELGVDKKNIEVVKVPGAIELPLTAKLMAQSQKYQAIICLGAVIRGETDHFDYVCQQVSNGCQNVMLSYNLPIIFGVLTTKNVRQALDRVGGKHGHKGREAADAAITMINTVAMLHPNASLKEISTTAS